MTASSASLWRLGLMVQTSQTSPTLTGLRRLCSESSSSVWRRRHPSIAVSPVRSPLLSPGCHSGWVVHQSLVLKAFNSTEKSREAASKEEGEQQDIASDETEAERRLKELQERHDDLIDKYRRSLAESDNVRKRLNKQIEDARVFGIQSFCKDLLDVADVLSKAANSCQDSSVEDMREGLNLTENQLQQVFRRHGLERVDPLGEKFDPNVHEALFQVPAPDKEPNIVVDVQKVGYVLHGRTVRPALVGVSKK